MGRLLMVLFLGLSGCFQTLSDGDDLRVVPVTNNPHIVPSHGNGMPMGGNQQGPY